MKFVGFVSVVGIFFLTACGPQVYYDPRISAYQKIMEQCDNQDRQSCQEEYDNMVISSSGLLSQYKSPFLAAGINTSRF